MNNMILINNAKTIKLNKFPNNYEISLIKQTHPKLKKIIFENATIYDFTLLNIFSNYDLIFNNSIILDYTSPISLNSKKIYFNNTIIDYEKLFFMTNMSNLVDIGIFYDSLEGIYLYKPYLHLLKFFPTLERIRVLSGTIDNRTYYDLKHTKVYEEGLDNISLLFEANIFENTDFLHYMPNYRFKSLDGLSDLFKKEDFLLWNANKTLFVNPKYLTYYYSLKNNNLKEIQELIKKICLYSKDERVHIGKDRIMIDFYKNPLYSYPDLEKIIAARLRTRRLNNNVTFENEPPSETHIYGMFGEYLYDTHKHKILVNSRGSIISDFSEDSETLKLKNNLLPF